MLASLFVHTHLRRCIVTHAYIDTLANTDHFKHTPVTVEGYFPEGGRGA